MKDKARILDDLDYNMGMAKAREKILNKINQKREDISFLAQVGSFCGSKKQEQMAECLLDLLVGQVMHVRLCTVCSARWWKYVAVSDKLAWVGLCSHSSKILHTAHHKQFQESVISSKFDKGLQPLPRFHYWQIFANLNLTPLNKPSLIV